MICINCKSEIENDSFYCDQCGVEIFVCPKCKNPGKGKRCTQDGERLISAKDNATTTAQVIDFKIEGIKTAAEPTEYRTVAVSDAPTLKPIVPSSDNNMQLSTSGLTLANKPLNLTLNFNNTDIIGRKAGSYFNIFSHYKQISGKHAQVTKDSKENFTIMDLGSTNGTFINGKQLSPNSPNLLNNGDSVKFADLCFEVILANDKSSDETVRI